jgi:hypothetical protein
MLQFYVTVGPELRADDPIAPTATWLIEAADEQAALDKAEVRYRRSHPDADPLRLRLTSATPR